MKSACSATQTTCVRARVCASERGSARAREQERERARAHAASTRVNAGQTRTKYVQRHAWGSMEVHLALQRCQASRLRPVWLKERWTGHTRTDMHRAHDARTHQCTHVSRHYPPQGSPLCTEKEARARLDDAGLSCHPSEHRCAHARVNSMQ